MSLKSLFDRWRRSVAIRVSVLFAVLFTGGFFAVFGALYWLLGSQLEAREHEALGLRLQQYRDIFGARGIRGLQERVYEDSQSPHVRSLFIRLMSPEGVVWAYIPPDWIEREADRITVPNQWADPAQRNVVTIRIPVDEQEDLAVLSTRVHEDLILQVARSTDNRTALLEPLRRIFLRVGGVVVLVGFAGGVFVARRATRPVQQVVETARRIIDTGEMDARVPLSHREDDVAELVSCFNSVLDKNNVLLRSTREVLDNVAHDLRTPLTAMRGSAELALLRTQDPSARDALAECIERSDEVLRLLKALMEITEAESGVLRLDKTWLDLGELARKAGDLYPEIAADKSIELLVAAVDEVPVLGDATRLRQALANLIDNAIKYTPEGGRVTIRAFRSGEEAVVEVSDTGPGVPEAEQPRIWERLYRADQSRSQAGLGLGLSLVRAIINAHGGRAEMRNGPEGGAVFIVALPLQPSRVAAASGGALV